MTAAKGRGSKGKGSERKAGATRGAPARRGEAKKRVPAKPRAEATEAPLAASRREEPPTQAGLPARVEVPEGTRAALARMRGMETLEAAYEAWLELKLEHAAARVRLQEEHERLEQQGAFLVGSVRAASQETSSSPGLVRAGAAPLDAFLREAEEKLRHARDALARRREEMEAAHAEAFAEVRATILDRVRRYQEGTRPVLELTLHGVGATRAILHARRVSGDEAVLLCYLFCGRIPSRYGFLFDDSTEDVSLPPAPLYPDEEVPPSEIRPDAAQLEARVRAEGEVLPLKGFLPVFVPRPGGGEDFFRFLQRGPVMEVEVAEGPAFRGILSREEAERFAGHLLRLKLEGRIELDIRTG